MEKFNQVIQKQIVDVNTGEIVEVETEKIFTRKIESDAFYMTFINYVAPIFKLKSDVAKNLLVWLCNHAEYNTGKVELTTKKRVVVCSDLEISSNTLTNNLKKLKDLKLIEGEKGDFIINPQIFWKGDTATRDKLLRDNDIKVMFKIGQ